MVGELYINSKDAYSTWGISLTSNSISALMTPAPNKSFIENKSRLEHGKRVITTNPKVDERNVTLELQLTAKSETEFFNRYESFCEELATGILNIRTKYQPTITYKMIYLSCNQLSQFMRGIGKFTLKLCEPNPKDRIL